ncbi:hypothetical protein PV08_09413 [Exophiala spinifera]|uniref:Two-component system protein A n=1 Tax=Exophiala spinifera TaxID=91928 RepID=A0A0D2AZJ8_9EURO|nr:uncharacterized protein PV08_09413 [Exophiala spinifera]KIW12138.1 hypothetical protein PV08_09413 [Exophiala spinifera]
MHSRKRIALDQLEDARPSPSGKAFYPASCLKPVAKDTNLSPPPSPTSPRNFKTPVGMERIFALSPKPTVVLDRDLLVVVASAACLRLFSLDLVIGRRFLDIIDKVLAPTDFAVTARLLQDAIQTREPQRTEPLLGSMLPGYWRIEIAPIYDGDELLYLVVEAQDASEDVQRQLQHYAQLSAAETYKILVSTLRDYAIFMLDPSGCIATWNTGAMLLKQYTQEEIIGRHFSTFYSEEDRRARKPERELEIALRDGKVEDEGWRVRKDGSRFWANVIITPVYRDGELRGYSKVTRDLTERKGAEARLIAAYEEASKMKSDFLANMSHEIRTPMHGMLSALGLLNETDLTREQRELTEIIDESGAILLQVINDILDYSKLSSGAFTISKDVMNMAEIVAAVRRSVNIGSKKDLQCEVELDHHLPTFVQGDPLRYRQLVQNLVSNAIKFTERGYVRVKVVVADEDDMSYEIRTEVVDTGIGVSQEAENVLFTPFAQLDNSSTKRYKGTGLGLSICKSLTELMGGTIGFARNPDQQGSIFHFTLNLNKVDVAVPPTTRDVTLPDLSLKDLSGHKQLLLVEDNAINQTIMVRQLRAFGFEKVDVASDGAEAVRLIQAKPLTYSLILMDISMPVMDGVTATKKIRSLGHTVPIIAMTANALKGDEDTYLAEGMNDYVAKPIDKRLLTNALLRWLR